MSLVRRWGLPALVLCLLALAPSAGPARAADENPAALDGKAVDALVHKTLREVINEGADMYNAQGRYKDMERDYAGCFHLYEGALIATRPLLAGHPDLQKAIDDGLATARATPRSEMRAFVLRGVIDKVRDAVNPNPTAVIKPPPTPPTPSPKTLWDRLGGEDNVAKVVDDFTAAAVKDPKVDFTRGGKYKLDDEGVKHFKQGMIDFVSSATGGPLKYTGKNMKDLHKGMEITNEEFDESVKLLKDALEKNGAAPDDEKAVLAAVEGTRKDIVEAKTEPTPPPPPPPVKEIKVEGKVTKVEKDKLTLKSDDGKEITVKVPEDALVTLDGKEEKLESVKPDSAVIVIAKGDAVTKVVVKSPAAPPPPPPPPKETRVSGKVVSADKDKVVLSADGKDKTFTVPAEAKVTIDDKDGKLEEIKKDSTIIVTSKGDAVIGVEVKSPAAPPPPPPPQTMWDRLGGEANVAKVVDDFVNKVVKDPKVNFFNDPLAAPSKEDMAALKKKFGEYLSSISGGPGKFEGKNLKDVQPGLKLTNEEFDAAVKDLKDALEKDGAKADDLKAIIAAVEATRKDVVVEEKKPDDKPKPPEDKKPDDKKPVDKTPDDKKPVDKPGETGTISGKVTYKGAPVTGCFVVLKSAEGRLAVADLAADGSFTFKDVKPGEYKVAVDANAKDPAKLAAVAVPKKYRDADTSGLSADVKKGEQTIDLPLND